MLSLGEGNAPFCGGVHYMVFGTSEGYESSSNSQMTCLEDNFLNPAFKDESDSEKQSSTDV